MTTVTFKRWKQERGAIGVSLAERVLSVDLTDEEYEVYSELVEGLGYNEMEVLCELDAIGRVKEV